MLTKHLFVLTHIKTRERLVSSKIFKSFRFFLTDRFEVVLLLWIFFAVSVSYLSVMSVPLGLVVICWGSSWLSCM